MERHRSMATVFSFVTLTLLASYASGAETAGTASYWWAAPLTLGGLGIVFAVALYVAGRFLAVRVDPRIEKVAEALPGADCGGCAFAGCRAYAEAIVLKGAECNKCAPGGAACAEQIAAIMGGEAAESVARVAVVHCAGSESKAKPREKYIGVETCIAAMVPGVQSPKGCESGCLGFSDCVEACPFDAIVMGADGLPFVIESRCTGCGKCVAACPRGIISLRPVDKFVHVLCCSHEKGGAVRKVCEIGCIGCKKCEKTCKFDAIHVKDFLAEIDYEKCTSCGACVKACPQGVIIGLRKARKRRKPAAGVPA